MNDISYLNECVSKYPSDKWIKYGHNYIPGYIDLFDKIKDDVKNVLEIGIGCLDHEKHMQINVCQNYKNGNSLRMWRDYFKNAQIYGIDNEHKAMLNNEERINTLVADQSSSSDLLKVMNTINSELDIIIDDGSHIDSHQVFSFIVLEKYLKKGGIYVIEDVQHPYIELFKNISIFPVDVREIINKNYEISYYDTRKDTGKSDDFLMVFKKK